MIIEAAREIWKSIDSSEKSEEILLSQMRKYKLRMPPYDSNYVFLNETPKIWWLSIDDPYENLQKLALIMYDITPHSAACERVFSTLGWIYNKKRLRLTVSKVEGMAKVRSYYLSMINQELKYITKDSDPAELREMVDQALENDDDDDDDAEYYDENDHYNDNDNDNDYNDHVHDIENDVEEELIIPNQNVIVVIENIFDLDKIPFASDPDDVNYETENSDSESSIEYDQNYGENMEAPVDV